jgi:hypothetical protein
LSTEKWFFTEHLEPMRFRFIFFASVLMLFTTGNLRITAADRREELTASDIVSPAYYVQSKADAGYVLEIEGRWYVDRNPREYLAMSQRVMAGDVIRILDPMENDHIVILGRNKEIIAQRYCARESCLGKLPVPFPASDSGVLDAMLDTVMRLIRGRRDRYSIHGQKGESNPLEEAVSLFDKGSLDLTPVFRNMPKGTYHLQLRDLRPGTANTVVGPLRFGWDPQAPSPLATTDLRSGVYEVSLLLGKGTRSEPSLSVWTLVSSRSEFDHLSNSFREAVRLTDKWQKSTTDETRRVVLRAYLDSLAESIR